MFSVVDLFVISTHTLTWSVTRYTAFILANVYNFNSHAHVERDFSAPRRTNRRGHFNSHAHVERDRRFSTASIIPTHFNSHAHVERDNRKTPPHFDNWHFNSHAHVERDFWELGILNAKKISTHTLTWSVTGN